MIYLYKTVPFLVTFLVLQETVNSLAEVQSAKLEAAENSAT